MLLRSLLVLLLSILLYLAFNQTNVTLPEGCAQPWTIRLFDVISTTTVTLSSYLLDYPNSVAARKYRSLSNFLLEAFTKNNPELKIWDANFDGVLVRIYEPINWSDGSLPGVIYYHGGGFVLGSRHLPDLICQEISIRLKAVVASVEYRLAPEVTYPVPIEDCVRAAKYFLIHAKDFDVDPTRIAVAGDSTGGNLATAVSLKLRDQKFTPRIKTQVLLYPAVQFIDFNLPSYQQNAETPVLKTHHMGYIASMYLYGNSSLKNTLLSNRHVPKHIEEAIRASYINYDWLPRTYLSHGDYIDKGVTEADEDIWSDIKDTIMNPYLSPLLAKDLSNLPDAFITTCLYDPLRDEGYLYAQRMKQFKNKVTYVNYEKTFHGVVTLFPFITEGREMLDDVVDYLSFNL